MMKTVGFVAESCTPSPQSRVMDLPAPEDNVIFGMSVPGKAVIEAAPAIFSSLLPSSLILLTLQVPQS